MTDNMSATEARSKAAARFWRAAALNLALHFVVGTILYVAIFAAAAGVSWTGEWFEARTHLHPVAKLGLMVVENVLTVCDVLLCVVYLLRTSYTFVCDLFSHDARHF